jgi:hypothetical protein
MIYAISLVSAKEYHMSGKGFFAVAFLGVASMALLALSSKARAWQPPVRTLTEQEIMDMMLGSSIQASRGANTQQTVDRMKGAIAQGRTFTMIGADDLPNDWTTVTVAGVGGGGAWDYVTERVKGQNLPTVPNAAVLAAQALSRHIGRKFNAVVRIEAAQSAGALLLASELAVPVVDACLSGRARPEIEQQIPWINGIPATPAALVTRWGDTVILDKTVDDYRAEDLGRAVAVASGGSAQMAMNPMRASDVRRGVIKGALSQAILFGKTAREAVAQGKDPVAELVRVTKGFKLFQGIVAKADMKGDRGFTWWDVELKGTDKYAGNGYKIYVKNENIVAWLDGVPDAMSPDTIQNLDPKTGDAHNGGALGGYKVGAELAIIGYDTSPLWRTPKGIEVFGPRHFGFDFDYVPIEQLYRQRKALLTQ